jgi:hypothetical protein
VAIWVILWLWPTPPPLFVLVGAPNWDNLAVPHNVPGQLGLKAIEDWADSEERRANVRYTEAENWDEQLNNIPRKTGLVVVYLALHGGADTKGPYLLPEGASPSEPDKFLRVKDVLARLTALGDSIHKLLILDAAGVPAHWALGMPHNDFARRLKELEQEIRDIPKLAVLCSADEGQQSWSSEELRQTFFSFHLLEGLKGAARDSGTTLDARQLYNYVRRQTQRWVRNNRDAAQTPFLLPSGPAGLSRAEAMKLFPAGGAYQPPDPEAAPGATFDPPKALLENWQTFERLRKVQPAPEVYAPQQWRRFEALLVRYEELVRWGELKAAEKLLKQEIDPAKEMLLRARTPKVQSAPFYALAWPKALGWRAPWSEEALQKSFHLLKFKAPPSDPEGEWDDLASGPDKKASDRQLLCAQLGRLILRESAGAIQNDAQKLVKKLYPGDERPAELNFLSMLAGHLDKDRPPSPEGVALALEVRQLAEEVALGVADGKGGEAGYPASEQVYRWIQDTVDKADRKRGDGQDRLFASKVEDWQLADRDLKEAKKDYESARATAAKVREALQVRDEVFAYLPYYTRWVANRRVERVVKDLITLWEDAHDLDDLLRQRKGADELAKKAIDVREAYSSLEKEFIKVMRNQGVVGQQTTWHELQAILEVPLIEPNERLSLLKKSRDNSRLLITKPIQGAAEISEKETEPATELMERGLRQASLALAALGHVEFDGSEPGHPKNNQALKYETVRRDLDSLAGKADWQTGLASVGERIGDLWRRLAPDIDAVVKMAREAGTVEEETSFLEGAERLCRLIDGAEVGRQTAEPGPVEELRNLRFQELLLWQARRALEDFWWGEARPYYSLAGLAYLTDARNVHTRLKDDNAVALEKELKLKGRLEAEGRTNFPLTTEQSFDLKFKLKAGERKPRGYVVTWVNLDPPEADRLLELDYPKKGEREVTPAITGKSTVCKVKNRYQDSDWKGEPIRPRQTAHVRLRGFYRGQLPGQDTRVDLYPQADTIVYQYPMPEISRIAARGDSDIQGGSLSIVLDYSGSMTSKTETGKTRIEHALEALEKTLPQVPEGTKVSVRIFGHKTGKDNTEPSYEHTKIKTVRSGEIWNRKKCARLMEDLRDYKPMNATPLAEAMVQAVGDFRDSEGSKILLVLTDGVDNMYPNRWKPQPEKILSHLRDKFGGEGIEIKMVCFKLAQDEEKDFKAAFDGIESMDPPGKVWIVQESRKLADAVEQALRPKLRILRKGEPVKELPRDGLPISLQPDQVLSWWPLTPDDYKIMVYKYAQLVELRPGERFLLQLRRKGTKVVFERGLIEKEYNYRAKKEHGDWRMTLLHNQLLGRMARPLLPLQLKVALEDYRHLDEHEGGVLKQSYPAFTWFEVRAEGHEQVPSLRVQNLGDFPAPCWSLNVPDWVAKPGGVDVAKNPAVPILDVYCSDRLPQFAHTLKPNLARHLEENSRVDDPRDRMQIDGHELTVTVRTERCKVSIAPDKDPVENDCLVVRLKHAKGKPVQVLPPTELSLRGWEHHFYRDADCYTGVFWPVTEEMARQTPFELRFVSIEAFKQAAPAHLRLDSRDYIGQPVSR